jgi:hypothetical protein
VVVVVEVVTTVVVVGGIVVVVTQLHSPLPPMLNSVHTPPLLQPSPPPHWPMAGAQTPAGSLHWQV